MVQTELGQREFTVGLVLREPADALSSRYMTAFATLEAIKAGDSTDKLIWAVEFVSLDFFYPAHITSLSINYSYLMV